MNDIKNQGSNDSNNFYMMDKDMKKGDSLIKSNQIAFMTDKILMENILVLTRNSNLRTNVTRFRYK